MQVDELLKERDGIQSSFTTAKTVSNVSGSSSNSKSPSEDPVDDSGSEGKNTRKKWFPLGGSSRKTG